MNTDCFTHEVAVLAKLNGCKPEEIKRDWGSTWHCTCVDNTHGCDQQCSIITRESAQRNNGEPRTLTRDEALVIGDATDAKPNSALTRAAERWGSATLYKCNP